MEQDYNLKKWSKGCPNTGINCRRSSCGIEYVFIPAALGDDQEGSPVAPKNGSYNNAIVYYEATGNVYLYSSDGVPTRVEKNLDSIIAELQRELDNVEEALSDETAAREAADAAIEQEIEDLRNEPDVVDIVGTYADLQAYDTSDLGDKDIIRVLVDETHDNESTYYRWNKTSQTWTFIGAIEGYYTRGQMDALLDEKQDILTAGDNIQISNNVISATDTTYTAGTNIQINGTTISATDTTYTAGTGLDLTGTQFSIDNATVATQSDLAAGLAGKQDTLTAGANITIDANNVISATGGGSGGVSDVQIAGTSIVNGGVANIDYASTATGGVIRVNTTYGINVAGTGTLIGVTKNYSSYGSGSDFALISKGTLENVITGKGLVSNTDYATATTGGVIKLSSTYATQASAAGIVRGVTRSYAAYGTGVDDMFICKGTLENVIAGKGLVDQTDLATKQDVLTAGTGISITNGVISCTFANGNGVSY